MESDDREPESADPTTLESGPVETPREETPGDPPDPSALVDRLIDTGEWPDPALLEQIIAAGEAALGPLLAFMGTFPDPMDTARSSALVIAMDILGTIRSPAGLSMLVEIIRRYPDEEGETAADTLADFGAAGFRAALDVVRDPTVTDYPHHNAIDAAYRAAGTDSALRAELADALRPMLVDAIERVRRRDKQADIPEFGEPDDEDATDSPAAAAKKFGYYNDADWNKVEPPEELAFLIEDLAKLADPKARPIIQKAFQDRLVDTYVVDKASIDETYRKGGAVPRPPRDWLEDYRKSYQDHIESLNRPTAEFRPFFQSTRPRPAASLQPGGLAMGPQETIHKTGPKVGRNDPCWCGSGKKYKKCHWGKDGR